mgnify:CR=1 FL=1
MLTKTRLKEQIESLPETFSLDDLVERLIFLEKVENGNQQSMEDKVLPEEKLDNEIAKWFS